MKWLSLFFAFYVLCLCAFPCQDNGDHSDFSSGKIVKEKTCDGHHGSNCCHKCSPFCFCNCCHVVTVVALKMELKEIMSIPVASYSAYIIPMLKEIPQMIWQPPKI